jgi:putative Holliday junction resolvase
MKYLGIDYGSKRIGLAVSDPNGKIAFPREVIENKGKETVSFIAKYCEREKIQAIVLGKSLNYKQEANAIQTQIVNFKLRIESLTHQSVAYQSEILTSAEAARNTKKENLDASAAALILQAYLDKENRK